MAGDGDLIINIDAEISGASDKMGKLTHTVDELGKSAEDSGKKGGILESAFGFAKDGLIAGGVAKIGGAFMGIFGDSIQQSKDSAAGIAQLDSVLKSTGGSAGVTKDQVLSLVDSLSANGGLSTAQDDAVMGGENMLLTFTNIGKDVFPQATQTMLDMATAMNNGVAPGASELSAQAIQLGKALNDPVHGMSALQKVGVSFTDDQKNVIKTMQETGDTAGAQKVILGELSKEFGGSAAAAAGTFDGQMTHLGAVFDNVKQALGDKLMPILTGAMSWLGSPAVGAAIQGVADGLLNGIGKGFDFIGGVVQTVQPYIESLFDFLKDTALPAAQGVFKFISDNATPALILIGGVILSQVVPAFIAWGTTMLTVTLPALVATMAPIIAAAAPFLILAGIVAGLYIAFQNNFLGIHDIVTNAMNGVKNAVAPFWNEIQPKIVAAWNAISSTAVNAWNWLSSTVMSGINALVGAWNSNWGGMQTIVTTAWNTITGIVNAAWTFVSGIINIGLDLLSGNWGQAWTDIQTTLSNVWNIITTQVLPNALSMIWTLLSQFVPQLIGVLAQWTGAFFSWIWNDVLPQLPGWLGNIVQAVWTFITTNGPTILAKLWEWTQAFFNWVMSDVLPKLPGWLGSVINAVWTFITQNGPPILAKLGEWTTAFFNWVMSDVVPKIPGWLGSIASKLWEWITNTAKDLGSKLVNEWIPSFWNWITGPGGVLANIGAKLGEIWTKITGWVGDTAKNIFNDVLRIGSGIVDGIKQGISNGWEAFKSWIGGLIQGVINGILGMLGIHSPSTVFADMGEQMVAGLQQGWASTFPAWQSNVLKDLGGLTGAARSALPQDQAPFTNPANSPGPNALPGTQPGGALTGGDYPGNGRVPVGGGGGSNGGSRSLGFTSAGGGGGVNIAVYVDGARWSIERVAQEMGLDFRVTTAGGRV